MKYYKRVLLRLPLLNNYHYFRKRYNEKNSISFIKFMMFQIVPIKCLRFFFDREDYLPHDKYSSIIRGNVFVGKCSRIQRSGCYIQGRGKVFIGDYVEMASNVVVISGNHDLYNQDKVATKETIIGDHCWIASNASILAGVVLGPRTIVGAGSVVTKSFSEGYCVIAGNPAKVIKRLDKSLVVLPADRHEYYGYLSDRRFKDYFNTYYKDLSFEYPINEVSETVFFKNKA